MKTKLQRLSSFYLIAFCSFFGVSCSLDTDFKSKEFIGDYQIESQAVLEDFANHHFVGVKGNLYIFNCEDLMPLADLTYVDGKLEIRNNKVELENLKGLENVTRIGGDLNIYQNKGIKSLTGLDQLIDLGGNIAIYENSRLERFNNLDKINRVTGFVNIYSNPNLVEINGLNQVSEIISHVDVNNNRNLVQLNGFKSIARIGNTLTIKDNQALTELNGFNYLISVVSKLIIEQNRNLQSISSLKDLTSVGSLSIKENNLLEDFCTLRLVNFGDSYVVSGNAYNPTKEQILYQETCRKN
ncbi:hypothetical protein [Ochrovirga pacifica]|uniref:hypothetical protein n=1 Tax=Ochrovirga pacifica TaxID=1042376 RepID=UPI0002558E9B|nr:hypothetical protein [Ochrovirga pacifica]